jgi:hypothetical protein
MLDRLERRTLAATQALAVVGLGALVFYAVMTLADGTLRSLANYPIDAVRDIGGLVCAVAVACCFPLAFLQRANIAIKFSEILVGKRASQALDALAAIAVEVAMLLIAGRLFQHAVQVTQAHDVTFMLAVPIGPFWLVAATLVALTAVVQAIVVVLEVARLFGRLPHSALRGEGA